MEKDTKDPNAKPNPTEIKLSASAQGWRDWDRRNLRTIAKQREIPYLQFDGMSYSMQYFENEKIGMSYIYPKKNKSETPFTSGIGAEKIKTLGSMINGYHFEPSFTIKYKNEPMDDLSTIVTNWVQDSRNKEKYDEKARIQNRVLFEQGTAYTIERYLSSTVADKKILSPYVDLSKLDKVKWVDNGTKSEDYCCTEHLRGTKVFWENMTLNDVDDQPRGYVVQLVQYDLLKEIFGKLENWQYVGKGKGEARMLGDMYGTVDAYHPEFLQQDIAENEMVEVFDRINGRYQIYISTIPMLEEGFPLKIVSPKGGIPIAKGDLNPSEDFAISRGIPFDMKIDQQLYDLTFKIALIKMKQSAYVPTVNNTGKYMSAGIYEAGMMSEGFNADKIQALIKDPGIKPADFSFLDLIKKGIDDKSINPILEGQAGDSNSLGEYLDKTRKAMLKIGYVFDAVVNWERQKSLLRFYNLVAYGIRKKPDGTYADLSLSEDGGDDSTLNVQFKQDNTDSEDSMFQKNLDAADEGRNVKHASIDPKLLTQILEDPDYTVDCEIIPVDKNNDTITQMKLVQKITQAQALFGPDSLAVDRLKKRYARVMQEDFDDFFKSADELQLEAAQAQQQMTQYVQNGASQQGNQQQTPQPNAQPVPPVNQTSMRPNPQPLPQSGDFKKQMVDGFFK